ncbi:hypothetical protein KGQ20_39300 [Catenulispora sp. NF23]|uniref:hypothetical protein n=1 Tax=Catenulispora pinistramenti TaxID=2705254 RepID=UPI001BAD8744|nr:hypothetical protein [Catenulispora pinistramenti]MBS2538811.1 hypothetical protein [Catenulispora pinistramenti]
MSQEPHEDCPPPERKVPGRQDNPPCPLYLTTVPEFIDCVCRTLVWSRLSLRQVEERAAEYGGLPRSTLSYMTRRKTLPPEHQLRAFVYACKIGNHWENWRITRDAIEQEEFTRRSKR